MTEINKLLDRYQQFYDEYFVHSPELYRKLSAEGQAPKTLVIACSDSRVDPSIIFKSEPGEMAPLETLEDMEREMIRKALERHEGNLSAVASRLGITRQTLYNKMKKFNL